MKHLLFVIPEYSHGGTNKSLENLLGLIDKSKYDISIYCLYEDGGEYYKKLFAPYILKKSWLYYWLHDNVYTRKLMGLYNKVTKRDNFAWLYKREANQIQRSQGFNTAVAYQEGTATQFVTYMPQGIRKIAWIHCDYGERARGVRIKEGEVYAGFNHVVCVSDTAQKSFCGLYPEYGGKTHSIYNLLDVEGIRAEAQRETDEPVRSDCRFKMVSIGRLNGVKQFDRIPMVAYELKKMSKRPFCWYIIGEGAEKANVKAEIEKYSVEDEVRLLGAKDNPYPYIKQANLLACTSSSESFSYVIAEAKILHTPVISNDFPVAYEVVDENTGWIANLKDMPELLARIIDDVDGIYHKKKESISNYEYNNDKIIQQIDQLFQN